MMRASSGWGSSLGHLPPAGDVGDEAAEAAAGLRACSSSLSSMLRGGEQQRLLRRAGVARGWWRPPCRRGRAWAG